MTDATLVPLGTANQETTYLYVQDDDLLTTKLTFVVSASGHKVLATDIPQNCFLTAADSGVCEIGLVDEAGSATSTFTTSGSALAVVLPVATTSGSAGSSTASSGSAGNSGGTGSSTGSSGSIGNSGGTGSSGSEGNPAVPTESESRSGGQTGNGNNGAVGLVGLSGMFELILSGLVTGVALVL
ncbi:hypothetical protein Moror_10927 [Moniliophthora roreri MCA 2997]|uniref:Uncharacterized protein n=2 Tax=Moniliophthora roreri TaxID=221103 RepID=V2WZJ2_MONRO|nr:hypothetical protein Moror_10927 [Moniliophthora roreri MCA 2997]